MPVRIVSVLDRLRVEHILRSTLHQVGMVVQHALCAGLRQGLLLVKE